MTKLTKMYVLAALGLCLAFDFGYVLAQKQQANPETIEVDIYYRTQWVLSNTFADEMGSGESAFSLFLAVNEAVDQKTEKTFVAAPREFGCDPQKLKHGFRLEKREFLLGEPILVEHRIELKGPGGFDWSTGGNYRSRGRDDNFSFIMRDANGSIVPDPYPKLTGIVMGGGLMGLRTVTESKPVSEWLGLQRYVAITQPGTYELYCLGGYKSKFYGVNEAIWATLPDYVKFGHKLDAYGVLVDEQTGQPSKTYRLAPTYHGLETKPASGYQPLPPDVLKFAADQSSFGFSTDRIPLTQGLVARFNITVRRGTTAEQRQMVEDYRKKIETDKKKTRLSGSYEIALLESFWYGQQEDFLPVIEQWVSKSELFRSTSTDIALFRPFIAHFDGLAMNPSPQAFAILQTIPALDAAYAFGRLHKDRIKEAIPLCIAWLTHEEHQVRAVAESRLREWTCQSFDRTWNGYHWERPTLEEGKKMQPKWAEWWKKNKDSQMPCKPSKDDSE